MNAVHNRPPLFSFFFSLYMSISGEVALNSDVRWYCNRITESSLEGFLPVSKASSSACRANSLGGLWGRLRLISISKPPHCQLSEAALPPVCAQVNACSVWGMTSPSLGVCSGRHGWRKEERTQHKERLISTSCIFISLIALLQKKEKKNRKKEKKEILHTVCLP